VIGDQHVGKTTFCSRFLIDYLPEAKLDFLEAGIRRMMKFDDQYYEIELVDT
jgi:GTPase SAR1 family protein